MSKWYYEAAADGDIDALTDKCIGSVAAPTYPTEMAVNAAILRATPFAFQGEDGTWQGFLFDLADHRQIISRYATLFF